jgi:CheY-like chemotaxis protein
VGNSDSSCVIVSHVLQVLTVTTGALKDSTMPEPPHILVLDDNARMVALIRRWLGRAGYRVTGVTTISEALEVLGTQRLDWVLTDLMMPTGDGMDILAHTRSHQPQAKVIIMTAFGSEATRQRTVAQGAHAFLSKPFNVDALLAILDRQSPSGSASSAEGKAQDDS